MALPVWDYHLILSEHKAKIKRLAKMGKPNAR